jgi:hypothetical protein
MVDPFVSERRHGPSVLRRSEVLTVLRKQNFYLRPIEFPSAIFLRLCSALTGQIRKVGVSLLHCFGSVAVPARAVPTANNAQMFGSGTGLIIASFIHDKYVGDKRDQPDLIDSQIAEIN